MLWKKTQIHKTGAKTFKPLFGFSNHRAVWLGASIYLSPRKRKPWRFSQYICGRFLAQHYFVSELNWHLSLCPTRFGWTDSVFTQGLEKVPSSSMIQRHSLPRVHPSHLQFLCLRLILCSLFKWFSLLLYFVVVLRILVKNPHDRHRLYESNFNPPISVVLSCVNMFAHFVSWLLLFRSSGAIRLSSKCLLSCQA